MHWARAIWPPGRTGATILLVLVTLTISVGSANALPQKLGDFDGDTNYTVLDLVRLINHVVAGRTGVSQDPNLLPPELQPFADLNEDGLINEGDVDALVNAILGIPIPLKTRPVALEPASGSAEVGVTVRPKAVFPKPIDTRSLNSSNFFAIFAGQKLPATIVPANNGTFAWLFFQQPMPSASQVQVIVDGSTIRTKLGLPLDADGDGTPGGITRCNFSTVSITPIPNTVLKGRIVDPGPDLKPRTSDDVALGNGYVYLRPIAGVKVFLQGMEDRAVFTDSNGLFRLEPVPVGDVKLVADGRTATTPHVGFYWPDMTMDAQMEPGITNTWMAMRDANGETVRDTNGVPIPFEIMYLPRIASNVLQTVSATNTTLITLNSNAAYNLPTNQQAYLTVEVQPGSLVGRDGQRLDNARIGISVVPPELVRDMLPPGLLQHTFDITVQAPDVSTFSAAAPMMFPNVFNAEPGTKLSFLSFDHTTGRLVIEGTATVSEDGLSVRTDAGTGITHPGWHGMAPPGVLTSGGGGGGCGGASGSDDGVPGEKLACLFAHTAYCEAKYGSPCRAACSECIGGDDVDPIALAACIADCAGNAIRCINDADCSDAPLFAPAAELSSTRLLGTEVADSGRIIVRPESGRYFYAFENLKTVRFEVRGTFDGFGLSNPVFLAPNTPYRYWIVQVRSLKVGQIVFSTSESGAAIRLPPVLITPALPPDSDGDGISDQAEIIFGTAIENEDSDNDAISDLAEIQQGSDPLSGRAVATGILASLALPGSAKEVVLEASGDQRQAAYVALGSRGLGIIDASQFRTPILLSQLDLPGDATDIAVDPALGIAVVAGNSGGLHFVNVAEPMNPALLETIRINATQVEVISGTAYVAAGNQIVSYDLATRQLMQTLFIGGASITALANEGIFLYTMDANRALRAIELGVSAMIQRGSLTMPVGTGRLLWDPLESTCRHASLSIL